MVAAREIAFSSAELQSASPPAPDMLPDETPDERDPLATYRKILGHNRYSRKKYTRGTVDPRPPHGNKYKQELSRNQFCIATATLGQSAVYVNVEQKGMHRKNKHEDQWKKMLLSSEELQHLLIEEATSGQGLLADD